MQNTVSNPCETRLKKPECTSPKPLPKERDVRDPIVPQLARRLREDRETWVVHMRQDGRSRKLTLGACHSIPVVRARSMALDVLGSDQAPALLLGNSTLSAFSGVFLKDCTGRWKPSTLRSHRYCFTSQILPNLGNHKLTDVTRVDVTKWFNQLDASKGARNRALSVLSSLMVHAEIRGIRPPGSNPCKGMRRHDRSFKANYLDREGYAALGRAFTKLAETEPMVIHMLQFCSLTGCRKSEALTLTWSMLNGKCAILPDSKTGPKTIWLGKPVRKLLAGIPQTSGLVFTKGDTTLKPPLVSGVWNQIRKEINMPGLRIHDLRHSFASVAVARGFDLLLVGGLLGHSDKGSTAGYAHLDTPALAAAAARVGKHFEKIVGTPKKRDPKLKAPKRKPAKGSAIFPEFIRSKKGLPEFCAEHDLDPKQFIRGLRKWRSDNRGAAK